MDYYIYILRVYYQFFFNYFLVAPPTLARYFITKREKSLLKIALAFLLQKVIVITQCDVDYKIFLYNLFKHFLMMFATSRCFWNNTCLTGSLLKSGGGWDDFFVLREKIISCAFLLGLVLKYIFRWFAQAFILLKPQFKLVIDKICLINYNKNGNVISKDPGVCCDFVGEIDNIDQK